MEIDGRTYELKRLTVRERLKLQQEQLKILGRENFNDLESVKIDPETETALSICYLAACLVSGPPAYKPQKGAPIQWSKCDKEQKKEVLYSMDAVVVDSLYLEARKKNELQPDQKKK